MSKIEGRTFVIQAQAPAKCSECGELAELRPYGKDGAEVCFPCAMKTPESREEAKRQVARRLEQAGNVEVRDGRQS